MTKLTIVLCGLFIGISGDIDIFRPKTIRFNVFRGRCSEYPSAPITYSNVQFSNINRALFLSMKVHIKRNINSEDLKLHLHLKRCNSNDALDTCETYNTVKLNHFCKILVADDKPWTPFRKLFNPPPGGCPLRKGEFEVNNGTFDGGALSAFPISNFYWKVTVLMLTDPGDEVVMCNKVEGQIAPI
ncbi:uncharacterized protein LOC126893299 [Diabrotica virgifera virgifera]|uniref:Uncharacterized protein n=2 Tax=Diabrotica virgifera virgifera TaxID=50390 RepID=A0ABM5LA01_DIAVI|nr:uncharacterized protein LOC126893299 [Diabrotica virgifera virgifera]